MDSLLVYLQFNCEYISHGIFATVRTICVTGKLKIVN